MDILSVKSGAVDQMLFRDAMARLGTSVYVVTTKSGGERYGFTASAVCSVSDAPPTVLFCINRQNRSFHAFANAPYFCINALMPGQEFISNAFGGGVVQSERFSNGDWIEGGAGVPILRGASVNLECQVSDFVDVASHRIMFGRVLNILKHDEEAALLHCRRRYMSI